MAENFLLTPATPEDIPSLIECYLSAFTSNNLTSFCFPIQVIGETEIRLWMASFLASHFTHHEIHFYKITEAGSGKVAAWMRCAFPCTVIPEEKERRESEKEEKRKEGTLWPKGTILEVVDAKFGGLEGMKERYFDEMDMYYVQLMATSPAFQKRGLASRLLRLIMNMADSEGRKIYIEASDAGFPVYEKLGWRLVGTVEVDLTRWGGVGVGRNRVMLRNPHPLQ